MATQAAWGERQGELNRLVRGWDRRLRVQQMTTWLPRCLLPGLAVGITITLISRLRPWLLPGQILLITGVMLLVGLAAMLLAVWLWPRPVIMAARQFDRLFGLRERVSTALELLNGRIHAADELTALQVDDAWAQARGVRAGDSLPLMWRWREWGAVLAAAAVLALLLILPNAQADAVNQDVAQQAALDAAAESLREITENVANDPSLTNEERQQLLEALEASSDILQEPNVTPEEAFAALAEAQAELQERADQLSQQGAAQQQALSDAANALREMQPGQQSGEQGQMTAAEALQQMAGQLPEMTPEQQQAAAQALQQAAQSLQNTNPEAAQSLQDAAESLQNGDTNAAQQSLNEAAQSLQQAQQQAQAQQGSAEQLSQAAQNAQQAQQQLGQQGQSGQQNSQPQASQQGQSGEQGQSNQDGQPSQNAQGQGGEQGQEGEEGQSGQQGQQPGEGQQGEQGGEGSQQPGQGESGGDGQPQDGQSGNTPNDSAGSSAGDAPGGAGDDQLGGPQSGQVPQNNNPDGTGEGRYDPVYAPRRIGGEGEDEIVLEPDASDAPVQEGEFAQNPTGDVTVPYNEVFSDYSDAANRALESDYIPLGLRDVVRDYFSSLEPGRSGRGNTRP